MTCPGPDVYFRSVFLRCGTGGEASKKREVCGRRGSS
jgi:hypothetical protein